MSLPQPSSTSPPIALPPPPPTYTRAPNAPPNRLNLPQPIRFLLANTVAFTTGLASGVYTTSRLAALRFRAENSHRLPRSPKNWYFYHSSKNYYVMNAAIRGGFRSAFKISFWTSAYLITEGVADSIRGRVDALGCIIAGGVTGVGFASVNRLGIGMVGLMGRKGVWYGFLYGVAQDLVASARGEGVWWIDKVVGRKGGLMTEEERWEEAESLGDKR